jgi:hypothetical protein
MKKRKRFIILPALVLALFAAGLTCGGSANAQTISNYNSRMTSCLNGIASSQAIVAFHYLGTGHELDWWLNQVYGQPYFDANGGGNVMIRHGGTTLNYYAWTYLIQFNGTIAPGSQGYVYKSGSPQADVNAMSNCVFQSSP